MSKPFENSDVFDDFRIDDRATFENHAPPALVARAANFQSTLVLWDQSDNEDGWMLCADDRDLMVEEFCEFFEYV